MNNLLNKLKRLYRQVRGLFPESLPTGVPAFQAWVDSFISTYTLPTEDRDTIVFVLSSMITHDDSKSPFTAAFRPKFYFYLKLKSAAAKQIAGAAFYEVKEKQKKAAAEAAAKAAEATAQPVASDEPK